jgi:hypothetical protein
MLNYYFFQSPLNVSATGFCHIFEAMDAGVKEELLAHRKKGTSGPTASCHAEQDTAVLTGCLYRSHLLA